MAGNIEGKRIIVTGGARGIGEAAVRTFVAEGASVVSLDVLDDAGQQVAEAATAAGPGSATYQHLDISRRDEVFRVIDEAAGQLGGLDALCNIAGIEYNAALEDITEEDLDKILDVNVKGTFFTNQAAFPHLRDSGGGSIVNVGSDAGLSMYPNGAHYSASKGAVMSMTRCAAGEWGKHGIRANSLVPAIWTPMYEEYRARMSADELAMHEMVMSAMVPLGGKLGDPMVDLAPVLVFLTSDASKFITGQIISVNGGIGQVR
jgi:NAD(P)-dependent dehydrogenase (short-subunit alcohol dehydrogenase family)